MRCKDPVQNPCFRRTVIVADQLFWYDSSSFESKQNSWHKAAQQWQEAIDYK